MPNLYGNIPAMLKQRPNWVVWGIQGAAQKAPFEPRSLQAFIRSPYHAQKDAAHQAKCQRPDYLPLTAQKACADVYSTAAADHERWMQSKGRERGGAR